MRLDRLILNNFITFDHLDYKFENRPLQVRGLNLTDEDQETNGVGKSGIQTAIEYLMTGQSSRGVTDSELITYGHKSSLIELYASCDYRKQNIHISCTINLKGANVLLVKVKSYSEDWVDGVSQKVSTSSNNDTKKFVTEWFGISKEDLFNYYLINGSKFKSFFTSSNKEKVELINRFSDASIIDGIEDVDLGELNSKKSDLEKDISKAEGKIELFEEQLESEESRDLEGEIEEEKYKLQVKIKEHEDNIYDISEISIPKANNLISDLEPNGKEIKKMISTFESRGKEFDDEIALIDVEIDSANKNYLETKSIEDEFETTDWDELRETFEDEIEECNDNINRFNKKLDEQRLNSRKIKGLLEKLSIKLSGKIDCPKCSHEFLLDGDIEESRDKQEQALDLEESVGKIIKNLDNSVEEEVLSRKGSEKEIQLINGKEKLEREALEVLHRATREAKEAVSSLEDQRSLIVRRKSSNRNSISDLESDLKSLDSKKEVYESRVESLKSEIKLEEKYISNLRDEISSLTALNNEEVLADLKGKILSLRKSIGVYTKKLDSVEEEIANTVEWGANFKRFKMYVANQSLEVIQHHSNRYLKDMGSDMRVVLSGSRELAKGDIKEEITAKIIRGKERSFKSFSGGEKGRLIFASILANRYMINETHPYGGLDFLSVDEVFEGVDSKGIRSIIESAKALNVSIMIITHVSDSDTSSDILTVVKENDISKIK